MDVDPISHARFSSSGFRGTGWPPALRLAFSVYVSPSLRALFLTCSVAGTLTHRSAPVRPLGFTRDRRSGSAVQAWWSKRTSRRRTVLRMQTKRLWIRESRDGVWRNRSRLRLGATKEPRLERGTAQRQSQLHTLWPRLTDGKAALLKSSAEEFGTGSSRTASMRKWTIERSCLFGDLRAIPTESGGEAHVVTVRACALFTTSGDPLFEHPYRGRPFRSDDTSSSETETGPFCTNRARYSMRSVARYSTHDGLPKKSAFCSVHPCLLVAIVSRARKLHILLVR